jgi:hypothetical protein
MSFKQILIIIAVIVISIIGLYYLMSPYQNCLRLGEVTSLRKLLYEKPHWCLKDTNW